jgi:signal peptidase I
VTSSETHGADSDPIGDELRHAVGVRTDARPDLDGTAIPPWMEGAVTDTPPMPVGGGNGSGGGDDGSGGGGGGDGGSGEPAGQSAPGDPVRRAARQSLEWVILIGVAVAIALVVKAFVVQAFFIPSESMVPTLKVDDRVLVNKLSYRLGDPERGDIVVFEAPVGQATPEVKDLIKRLVGLPGDIVEGRDGHVYINGQLLVEPYLQPTVTSKTFGPYYVPARGDVIVQNADNSLEVDGVHVAASLQTPIDGRLDAQGRIAHDHYYMLGDNRLNSKDSTEFGPVDGESFVGRAFIRVWPLGSFGLL